MGKPCVVCGQLKRLEDYHKDTNRLDGHCSKCKECACKDSRIWRVSHLDRERENNRRWNHINRDRKNARARVWEAANSEKLAAQRRIRCALFPQRYRDNNKRWRLAHPDTCNDASRAWQKANPIKHAQYQEKRRAAKAGAKLGQTDFALIMKRDKRTCHICGTKVTKNTVSFDHLVPLSKGGPHTIENLRVAHRRCNSRRGAGRIPAQLLLFGE